jgi:DNA-binding MarR family transcriptional regulator
MGSHTNSSDIRLVLDCLRRIVQALRLFDRESEKRLGLSGAQAFVLEQLRDANGISVNELAARTHTDQSSVSVVVQKLTARRLVNRSTSAADARRAFVSLTPKGRRLLRSAPQPAQNRLIAALAAFPKNRRAQLGGILLELIKRTGINGERATLFFEDHPHRGRSRSRNSK